jgi:hypothetical protein
MPNVLEPENPDNEDNNNEEINNKTPIFTSSLKVSELPIEKQFTHITFISKLEGISLDEAKQLLEELHLLYLSQMHVVSKIVKQEFLGGF